MDRLKEENMVSKDSPMVNPLMATKIKIGKGNIFEGGVEIETAGGEIVIGNYNVFENAVKIINTSATATLTIDSNNYMEAKTYIRDSSLGNYNVLKTYCMVNGSILKDLCVIAMCSTLHPGSLGLARQHS
jgi:bifunctional N-acetylglucosamine-1-phosphate-uridyltransferase/glucosamine-1-phosphate-acetyltransferase GlmU-like protein